MKLTVLIATMNEHITQLAPKIAKFPAHVDVIICHQITNTTLDAKQLKKDIENSRANVTIIQKYEQGLSKSRNCAIDHVKDGICMITDDDVYFPNDFDKIIIEAYISQPDADIITFQAYTPEGVPFNSYLNVLKKHTIRSAAKVSSVEITFRKDAVTKSNLHFDERFGLGSLYPTSEEYIFLTDAIKKGLCAYYYPAIIALHPLESSGSKFNKTLLKAKGAVIRRVYGVKSPLICIAFVLKKFPLYHKEFSFFTALLWILSGNKISMK